MTRPTVRTGSSYNPRASVKRLGPLGLVGLLLAASGATHSQQPPSELRQVGDHWTAWDPPTSFPEGTRVYSVAVGDTLWDLAERLYGDPYLWPQIWEQNQYVLDAHWIYPGDPLVLGVDVAPGEDVLTESTTPPDQARPGDQGRRAGEAATLDVFGRPFGASRSSFVQLGKPDDIYCAGFIGELEEEFGYRILGSEADVLAPTLSVTSRGKIEALFGPVDTVRYNLTLGDIVYLDGGRDAGLSPGDVLTAMVPGELISHPFSRAVLGRLYSYQGRVRVLSVQPESAIAEVSQTCTTVLVGAGLRPFEPEPVPSERVTPIRPLNFPTTREALRDAPTIVYAKDGLVSLGNDHVVFIDRGEQQDVTPGDIYTIYRLNRRESPPVVLGELAVLSVHRIASVAKIIESRHPIFVGDLLELK